LTAQIPDTECDVFVCESFDVEADGGDSGYDFADLKTVEDGCFSGVVETED